MKYGEKILFDKLRRDSYSQDEPLKNVKNALGSIAYAKGNPLTKTEITLQITSYFQLVGGGIIAPAALPAQLQTSLPVYIFGLTDCYSGYLKSITIIPDINPWNFNGIGAGEPSVGIFGYIRNLLFPAAVVIANGDMLLTFQANVGANTYNAYIVIHCNNVGYGTFLNSFVSDLITISTIRYFVPAANINQFVNPVIFGYQTLFGKLTSDSIDPRMYITSKDFQPQIADLPIHLPIDKNMMCGFQLDVFCQQVSWVLFVEKIEPLTHRRK